MGFVKDVVSGVFGGADAAIKAADIQQRQQQQGIQAIQTGQQSAIATQRPFERAGLGALQQQQALLGLGGQQAQTQALQALEESPGQRFLRQRGQRNLLQSATAIGGLGGGNVREALVQQGVGFAQQNLDNQQNRLAQLAGVGGQAAANISNIQFAGGKAQATGITNLGTIEAGGVLQQQQARAGLAKQAAGLATGGFKLGDFSF